MNGAAWEPKIEAADYMEVQQTLMANLVAAPELKNTVSPPQSAKKSVELIQLLCQSADQGGEILLI